MLHPAMFQLSEAISSYYEALGKTDELHFFVFDLESLLQAEFDSEFSAKYADLRSDSEMCQSITKLLQDKISEPTSYICVARYNSNRISELFWYTKNLKYHFRYLKSASGELLVSRLKVMNHTTFEHLWSD